MFDTIIIMLKCAACIIRWINENTLDLPRKLLFQRLQRQQVVAKDQAVVEKIGGADAVGGVVAAGGVFEQDARFQPRAALFADPGQFQFLSAVGHDFIYADHAVYDCALATNLFVASDAMLKWMQE